MLNGVAAESTLVGRLIGAELDAVGNSMPRKLVEAANSKAAATALLKWLQILDIVFPIQSDAKDSTWIVPARFVRFFCSVPLASVFTDTSCRLILFCPEWHGWRRKTLFWAARFAARLPNDSRPEQSDFLLLDFASSTLPIYAILPSFHSSSYRLLFVISMATTSPECSRRTLSTMRLN